MEQLNYCSIKLVNLLMTVISIK